MERSKKPLLSAIGCTIILTVGMGILQVLNVMIPDIVASLQVELATVTTGPMLGTFSAFIFSLLATKLIAKFTPRWSLLIGTIFAAITMVLIAVATNLAVWYIACICSGVVLGIGAHAAVAGVVGGWYGPKTASVFGTVAGVSALLIAVLVFITGQLLAIMDYRSCVLVVGGIVLVLGVLSNLICVRNAPVPTAAPEAKQQEAASEHSPATPAGITMKQALKTAAFILFMLAMFIGAFPTNGFSAFTSTFFASYGVDPTTYTTYISAYTAFAAIITIVAGYVVQKLGSRVLLPVMFICFVVGVALLLFWTSAPAAWCAYLSMFFASFIGLVMILPGLMIPELFGMKDYTSINAAGMAAFYIGAGVMMVAIAVVAQTYGMNIAYIVLAVLGLVALLLFLISLSISPLKKQAKK